MSAGNRITMLIENKWEKYDVKKMKKVKGAILVLIMVFLWFIEFQISLFVFTAPFYGLSPTLASALVATISVLVVLFIAWIGLKRIDVNKKNWYFSAYMNKNLRWEDMVSFMWKTLKDNGYDFVQEESHRTATLRIMYFKLGGKDFKARLWFSTIGGTPVVEIGVGPENEVNKDEIRELRDKISAAFKDFLINKGALKDNNV